MQALIKREVVDRKLLRMNKNLKWLAYKLDTSQSYLSKMLSGERGTSDEFRGRLMDTLGVEVWDDLFEEVEDESN
jgi:hypothetical protein